MGVKKVSFVPGDRFENVQRVSEQTGPEWLFDDALEIIGFGKVQYYLIVLSGFTLIAILCESMGSSVLQTAAQCDLELDSSDKGWLTSVGFLGLTIPSYMWGYISDQYGRRNSMIYTLLATNICSVGSSFAPNLFWLCVSRFFAGFFISACTGSIYPYLGEFNTVKHQTSAMAWSSIGSGLGLTLSALIAWGILQFDFQFMMFGLFIFRPWRLITIGLTICGFLVAICLFYFPESPKYYMSQGNEEKALEVLKWIYRKNTGESDQFYPVKRLKRENEAVVAQQLKEKLGIFKLMWNQTVLLLKPPLIIPFSLCCYLFITAFGVSGGIGLWMPGILNIISKSAENQTMCQAITNTHQVTVNASESIFNKEETCDDSLSTEAFLNLVLLGLYYSFGYIAISVLLKPLGRKLLLGLGYFMSAALGVVTIWIVDSTLQVISLSFFLVCTGLTISLVSGAAVTIFPTHIRATAICVIMMTGRISIAISSVVIGFTLDTYCVATISFMIGIVLIAGILNFFLK